MDDLNCGDGMLKHVSIYQASGMCKSLKMALVRN